MKRVRRCLIICVVLVLAVSFGITVPASQTRKSTEKIIAILGIPQETEALAGRLTNSSPVEIEGLSFFRGTLSGRTVVLGRVGFGKVNAALAATLLAEHFKPEALIFTGSAGALNPDFIQGDVVVAVNTAYHDFGEIVSKSDNNPTGFIPWQTRNPITGTQNPLFFPADERLRAAAVTAGRTVKLIPAEEGTQVRPPKVFEAVIVTGDTFISDRIKSQDLKNQFDADAVEMEGAAVAQICWQFQVPCLVIRSISDRADGTAHLDYARFVKIAAENSSRLVEKTLAELPPFDSAPLPSVQQWKCAFELAFGEDSPYSAKFPDLYQFPYEVNLAITKEVLDQIVDVALRETGLKKIKLAYSPGGYKEFPVVPSAQLDSEGTDANARNAVTVIGYLAQQTAVIASRRGKAGNRPALEIVQTAGRELADPKFVEGFFHRLTAMSPKLGPGFSSIENDGHPGTCIIDSGGEWTFKDFPRFTRTIKDVSSELKISTDSTRLEVEYLEIGNDWRSYSKGEQYLERLTKDLRDKLVNLYQPQVERWIERAFDHNAPANMPLLIAPRPPTAVRKRLYTKRPPAQKPRTQDRISQP